MSSFGWTDVTAITAAVPFVFWQPYQMTKEDVADYEAHLSHIPEMYRIKPWVFPIVWGLLNCFLTVTLYLYPKYVISFDVWYFPAFVALFLAHVLLEKGWSFFHFQMRSYGASLLLCILIAATGIAALVILGLHNPSAGGNIADVAVYAILMVLFGLEVAWTSFAVMVNYQWYAMTMKHKKKHHHKKHDDVEYQPLPSESRMPNELLQAFLK